MVEHSVRVGLLSITHLEVQQLRGILQRYMTLVRQLPPVLLSLQPMAQIGLLATVLRLATQRYMLLVHPNLHRQDIPRLMTLVRQK